jgi:ABC-type transport system involved in cytochrome bd biosynthesis fused ATPase/permease subunit
VAWVSSHTDESVGSGKTLMLLAMLGEADILAGQVISPRSPPDALARLMDPPEDEEGWVVPNMCAYVPQITWLQNATIKENILFNLPLDEQRYQETLEVRLIQWPASGRGLSVARRALCWLISTSWRTVMRARSANEV